MKLNRFLNRQIRGFRQYSVSGAVGGRSTNLYHFGYCALRPFKGRLSRHRLILMRVGSVVMERDGQTYLGEQGDALLVPAGECELTFLQCPQSQGVQAEILEFDHRTLAPRFRNSPGWEPLAYHADDAPAGAVHLPGMAKSIYALLDNQMPARPRFPLIMGELFRQFRRGLPQFLKAHFYLPRWRLFALLERYVLLPNGAALLGAEYPGGAKQLRKDSLVYLGAEPNAVVARRRCELATAWLRCGHSIDDVGQALGFSSRWEFESVYSGRKRQRCADVQAMPPLATAEPEELVAAMQPFWWPNSRPTRFRIPRARHSKHSKQSGFLSEMSGDEFDDVDGNSADNWNSRRAKVAGELRESAKDFFAMKSTGAEIIVPIFDDREVIELKAA